MIGLVLPPHMALAQVESVGYPYEPVDLSDAKDALRIADDDFSQDNVIGNKINAARIRIENEIRRVIVRRQFDLAIDAGVGQDFVSVANRWPHQSIPAYGSVLPRVIEFPIMPLVTVDSVTTYDSANAATVMDPSLYYADTLSEPPRLALNQGVSWPSGLRALNAIIIRFTAGYTNGHVPGPLVEAIQQAAAFLFEHRGESPAGLSWPPVVADLLAEYRMPEAG